MQSDETTEFGDFAVADIERRDVHDHHRDRISDAWADAARAFMRLEDHDTVALSTIPVSAIAHLILPSEAPVERFLCEMPARVGEHVG